MRARIALTAAILVAAELGLAATRTDWQNPVFESSAQAVAAARAQLDSGPEPEDPALQLFLESSLSEAEVAPDHPASATTRSELGRFLITHPRAFLADPVQRATVERFRAAIPAEEKIVRERLTRFAYPELDGLVFLRLVESVDAFAALGSPSSDRMSQVGGVTFYCRYIVLPLSYVGEQSLRQLYRSAALNPTLDTEATVRRWQSESFASLVNTFRHELVHVHTNATLGVPRYADRRAIPTWFHEGTATYLAGDPRAGLSQRYQQYQDLLFFLVERHGVAKLQSLYRAVLGGDELGTALRRIYGLGSSHELFEASSRWHRSWELGTTLFWIGLLAAAIGSLRSERLPLVGSLMVFVSLGLGCALAGGFAEQLWGLEGTQAVLVAKLLLGALAIVIGIRGVQRIRRHRRAS